MSDEEQKHRSDEPGLSWHFLNAVICTGLWFLAFAFGITVVVGLSPKAYDNRRLWLWCRFFSF